MRNSIHSIQINNSTTSITKSLLKIIHLNLLTIFNMIRLTPKLRINYRYRIFTDPNKIPREKMSPPVLRRCIIQILTKTNVHDWNFNDILMVYFVLQLGLFLFSD